MIADRTLNLTKDGRVVEEGDPESFEQLTVKGCFIEDAIAKKHGLLDADGKPVDFSTADEETDGADDESDPAKVKHPKRSKK